MIIKTKYILMIVAGFLAILLLLGAVLKLTDVFKLEKFSEREHNWGEMYKNSSLPFYSIIDMINGGGEDGSHLFSRAASSKKGMIEYDFNGKPYDGSLIVVSGWCLVGSVEGKSTNIIKYVWTVDGYSWFDVDLYRVSNLGDSYEAMVDLVSKEIPDTTFYTGSKNSTFQGGITSVYPNSVSGLGLDLSKNYSGMTVDIILGAVPEAEPDSVIKIIKINNIDVSK